MTDLLILADAGGDIGFGHLMRCLAIKNSWNYGVARLLVQMEDECCTLDGTESLNWLCDVEQLKRYATTNILLLVDSYRPNADYFRLLKNIFPFVAVLDDYNRISYPVDLVICPGVYGKEIDYHNQSAMIVGGREYVILQPEIVLAGDRYLERKGAIRKFLLTLGGSQQNEKLFQSIIDILEKSIYQLVVVTGNDLIAKQVYSKKFNIYGRLNSIEMIDIMLSVDIAISAAGQTLNELTWLGIPTLTIKTGHDQHENWVYYTKHNLSLAAILPDTDNILSILNKTLNNEMSNRKKRVNKLKKLLTSNGASTVCSAIKSLSNKL